MIIAFERTRRWNWRYAAWCGPNCSGGRATVAEKRGSHYLNVLAVSLVASHNAQRYNRIMIRSFADRETQVIWEGRQSRKLPADIQATARRKLRMLNNARDLIDLRVPPGNRLETLKGTRAGQHSIRINDQWRICFEWNDNAAAEVEIVDYH